MAKVLTKADVMMLYKCRFGDKALLQSIHNSYKIKDYEKTIKAYDTIYSNRPDKEKQKVYRILSSFEKEAIDVDFPDYTVYCEEGKKE